MAETYEFSQGDNPQIEGQLDLNGNEVIDSEIVNDEIVDNETNLSDREILNSLLDLLGAVDNGSMSSTFEADKEEILNSGISSEDFFSLIADNMAKYSVREPVVTPIQLLSPTAIRPSYAHDTDACADIYADEDVTIAAGATALVSTGISLAVPVGHVVKIFPRSGLSCKSGLRLANSVGIIDSGYRDMIKVCLWNSGSVPYTINSGDRIAQMCIEPSPMFDFQIVENIKAIGNDRNGGFGSTGV